MCGIAGAVRGLLGDDPEAILHAMNTAMLHRGPDMGEIYSDESFGLCHRRLSIIDLSEDGRQPMWSSDGRYLIVFNGEIYNYLELRAELVAKGYQCRTKTDTEILLQLYIEYGPASLEKINGMFAYAIWDRQERQLFAARDRIGKKPFYYYLKGRQFAFASEIKSLLAIPGLERRIDYTAFIDYLKFLFIPHPKSIYQDIFKLPPGHYLTWRDGNLQVREYWDVNFSSEHEATRVEELEEELLEIIRYAVRDRLMADVPLGAFLSGGIDSSGVVALMAEASTKPITTCTIGFDDKKINEAEFAKEFAARTGCDHHEHYVRSEPAKILKKLVWHCDEPFADSSMVPTYYVSKMARKHVTVALSGDGGDENFAGYAKYSIDRYENLIRSMVPRGILRLLQNGAQPFRDREFGRKLHSLTSSALRSSGEAFHITNTIVTDEQLSRLLSPSLLQEVGNYSTLDHTLGYYNHQPGQDHLARVLYTDLKLLLPGDFLVKVDRMSMANSLEVRSPLLDTRLIEFAAKIPSRLKLKGAEKKYILRKALEHIVPREILLRKKQGFEAPISRWFRNDIKDLARVSFFESGHLEEFLDLKELHHIWQRHQAGENDEGTLLWTVLMFSLWLEGVWKGDTGYA